MDLNLQGKVAIVGGGSDGLGFAMVDSLLAEGASVAFFGRRPDKVAAAVDKLSQRHDANRILGVAADCSNGSELTHVTASTTERFGQAISVLITNDGGPPVRPIADLTDDAWALALQRHFFYVVRSVRATLPYMTAGGGSILNVVSGVVHRPAINMAAPVAVWSAVIGYAQTLALEIGQHDISINTILAGLFDTALVGKMLDRQPELSKDALGSGIPMGRIGEPAEFASMATALVSPRMRFVTGTVIPVDGGSLAGAGFDSPAKAN